MHPSKNPGIPTSLVRSPRGRGIAAAVTAFGLAGLMILVAGLVAAPTGAGSAAANPATAHLTPSVSSAAYHSQKNCAGMLWAKSIWAAYHPKSCWGHDEPTMSYLSNSSGSGANASFQVVLPADGRPAAQGDLYATFWFGGTVYDPASTGGGLQAFLELQFYPAAPAVTGPGSGTQDCLSYGGFNPSFHAGSNDWFACAIVWQLQNVSGYIYENAAYAGPIDNGASTAILVMHSHDHIYVNYSGIAQSKTVPWKISVADTTQSAGSSVLLQTGSLIISPYYSTAAKGNTLYWGASNPGAIAFAYEIGHTLNSSSGFSYCAPGDGVCQGYWPGHWNSSGQMELSLPRLGNGTTATFPSQLALSSSQGGEYEVNSTSCASPSFSTSTNCMYPFYQYRGGFASFTFGSSQVRNDTHDMGNQYQFPASTNSIGQWNASIHVAPWGSAKFSITPSNATAQFNPAGLSQGLALSPTGKASGQFMEGAYWLNVSESGCSSYSKYVYLTTGGKLNLTATLPCGPGALRAYARASPTSGINPLTVNFTGHVLGGTKPYAASWSFGDGKTSTLINPSHVYRSTGTFTATISVSDANGTHALSWVSLKVSTASCAGLTFKMAFGAVRECHLNMTQQTVFLLNVTRHAWLGHTYLSLYAYDGSTSGTQPIFRLGSGMGGTPSLANSKQNQSGPYASILISLTTRGANVYGGWGNYWAIVTSPGGSGGFCFQAVLDVTGPGSGPTCHAATPPLGGGPVTAVPSGTANPPAQGALRASIDSSSSSAGALAVHPTLSTVGRPQVG